MYAFLIVLKLPATVSKLEAEAVRTGTVAGVVPIACIRATLASLAACHSASSLASRASCIRNGLRVGPMNRKSSSEMYEGRAAACGFASAGVDRFCGRRCSTSCAWEREVLPSAMTVHFVRWERGHPAPLYVDLAQGAGECPPRFPTPCRRWIPAFLARCPPRPTRCRRVPERCQNSLIWASN